MTVACKRENLLTGLKLIAKYVNKSILNKCTSSLSHQLRQVTVIVAAQDCKV